jgi:aminoglycoside 6'-N-acetyltransferase
MENCPGDYNLLVKWLSDPEVLEYYEGRSNPYNLEKVMNKFGGRTRGEDYVIPCIVECDSRPIGYIQYYREDVEDPVMEEYPVRNKIDKTKYSDPYGIDIVIGETNYWNKGLGTRIMQLMIKYLFEQEKADIILIGPQTRNKRAIRCYDKCCFKPVSVLEKRELHDGKYEDCLIMAITSDEWTSIN